MKLIIEIPEREYKVICENNYVAVCACPNLLSNAIKNGTSIPDNATNGDVIKTMFGIKEVDMSNTYCVHFPEEEEDYSHYFFKDWWNSLYQKGGK